MRVGLAYVELGKNYMPRLQRRCKARAHSGPEAGGAGGGAFNTVYILARASPGPRNARSRMLPSYHTYSISSAPDAACATST